MADRIRFCDGEGRQIPEVLFNTVTGAMVISDTNQRNVLPCERNVSLCYDRERRSFLYDAKQTSYAKRGFDRNWGREEWSLDTESFYLRLDSPKLSVESCEPVAVDAILRR
ncbi:hypothetical protein WJS89_05515 [Sphingomicrobium sp. XHP0235]|uniref:hypothetical protein n=1 Tax=Sphingomicrobium aquimarinum TaxID=3133971 RepID=UPI0031FEB3BA